MNIVLWTGILIQERLIAEIQFTPCTQKVDWREKKTNVAKFGFCVSKANLDKRSYEQ